MKFEKFNKLEEFLPCKRPKVERKKLENMKAMTKQQLAQCAGVTVRTLMNWCRPYHEELERMGMQPNMKVLPPHIAKWIADRFCIDLKT